MEWMSFVAAVAASDGCVVGACGGEQVAAVFAAAPAVGLLEELRGLGLTLLLDVPSAAMGYAFVNTLVGLAVLPLLVIAGGGRRRCPRCREPRRALLGEEADAVLTEGQRVERRLGSVVHEVLACRRHPEPVVVSRVRRSPYRVCPACNVRAALRRVGAAPDEPSTPWGRTLVTLTCAHCGVVGRRTYATLATPDGGDPLHERIGEARQGPGQTTVPHPPAGEGR